MKTLQTIIIGLLLTIVLKAFITTWGQSPQPPIPSPIEILHIENSDEMETIPHELYIVIRQDGIATGYLLNTETNTLTEVQFYD